MGPGGLVAAVHTHLVWEGMSMRDINACFPPPPEASTPRRDRSRSQDGHECEDYSGTASGAVVSPSQAESVEVAQTPTIGRSATAKEKAKKGKGVKAGQGKGGGGANGCNASAELPDRVAERIFEYLVSPLDDSSPTNVHGFYAVAKFLCTHKGVCLLVGLRRHSALCPPDIREVQLGLPREIQPGPIPRAHWGPLRMDATMPMRATVPTAPDGCRSAEQEDCDVCECCYCPRLNFPCPCHRNECNNCRKDDPSTLDM